MRQHRHSGLDPESTGWDILLSPSDPSVKHWDTLYSLCQALGQALVSSPIKGKGYWLVYLVVCHALHCPSGLRIKSAMTDAAPCGFPLPRGMTGSDATLWILDLVQNDDALHRWVDCHHYHLPSGLRIKPAMTDAAPCSAQWIPACAGNDGPNCHP